MEALRQLAMEYGVLNKERERQAISIMGHIEAGGAVDGWTDQAPDESMEQIELPDTAAIASSMIANPVGFRVLGDSMYPRFRDGEILVVERYPRVGIETFIYIEAAIITVDGLRCIKRVMPGRRPGIYTLESVNPVFPPIADVAIRWASPVRFMILNVGL
ncbi:MAG: S24 family peptidase [Rhizobiaceae bacterium]|nr:S24 family peptidase [Rhizobiaceae bacterium]